MHNYHITYLERSYLQSLLRVGCNGAWILGDYVSGTGALQRSETVALTRGLQRSMGLRAYVSGARLLQRAETVAPTRGLQRGMGFEGLRIRGEVASTVVDRASPVFRADEDVHNPSVDGLSTSWGGVASTV